MPVVIPFPPGTPALAPALAAVYDTIYGHDGLPVVGAEVRMSYVYELPTSTGVSIRPKTVRTLTGMDGVWVLWVDATDQSSPPNGSYIVQGSGIRAYRVRPLTPFSAAPTDFDAYQVPAGSLLGAWVHGQRSQDINISVRPATL